MDLKDLFKFEGKNVVITGSASGMSKAATELLIELDANIYAVDMNPIDLPVKKSYMADLSDKNQIDSFLKILPEQIDALFLCHGIATHPGNEMLVEKVNFLSQKYMIEQLLPRMTQNSSISIISSFGGFGWEQVFPKIQDLLNAETWDEAIAWYDSHPEYYDTKKLSSIDYTFAKQCLNAYVEAKAFDPRLIEKHIRINAIGPGDTKTGLSEDFAKSSSSDGTVESGEKALESIFLSAWNGRMATSEEMGYPLVVIGSDICSYMSGQVIYIDHGLSSSVLTKGLLGGSKEWR